MQIIDVEDQVIITLKQFNLTLYYRMNISL